MHTSCNFLKRNTLLPFPKCFFNLPPGIWVARVQLQLGSFFPRRKSLGTRLGSTLIYDLSKKQLEINEWPCVEQAIDGFCLVCIYVEGRQAQKSSSYGIFYKILLNRDLFD